MKIIRVEQPKDTKYTVELNYEELRVIADSVKKTRGLLLWERRQTRQPTVENYN